MANGKFWVNNHAHIISGNALADTRFLHYFFRAFDISPFLTGSTRPKLTQGQMNRIPVLLPSLFEQRAISSILGALDDKIALNQRVGETLQAVASAIFKSWFVEFDPVVAKSNGRWNSGQNLPGLPADLFEFFPDNLVDSELGMIPSGWTVGTFGHLTEQRKERVGEGEAVVLSAVASGELVVSDKYFTKRVYSKDIGNYLLVEQWDIAYNPSRINIGSVGMLEMPIAGAVSPVYVVARPIAQYRWILEFSLRRANTKEWINTLASGSVRQSLSYSDFASIPCVIPSKNITAQFDNIWTQLRQDIQSRLAQTQTLTEMRDTLLPKLVSGEIRIKEAEKSVEEHAG